MGLCYAMEQIRDFRLSVIRSLLLVKKRKMSVYALVITAQRSTFTLETTCTQFTRAVIASLQNGCQVAAHTQHPESSDAEAQTRVVVHQHHQRGGHGLHRQGGLAEGDQRPGSDGQRPGRRALQVCFRRWAEGKHSVETNAVACPVYLSLTFSHSFRCYQSASCNTVTVSLRCLFQICRTM